jgi:hypothetical protein
VLTLDANLVITVDSLALVTGVLDSHADRLVDSFLGRLGAGFRRLPLFIVELIVVFLKNFSGFLQPPIDV